MNALANNDDRIKSQLAELEGLNYRFTRPISERTSYSDEVPPEKLIKAIILDTETTGLKKETDKIIELGMIAFEFCPTTGQAFRVLGRFNQLEDPNFPIPPETTKVNKITDEMVSGKVINDNDVVDFIDGARLIIAHNAKFDRPFVESRFPIFEKFAWACSQTQIPWSEEGLSSAKQEYIAYRLGFHYDGHRALNDCEALLEILQQKFPESGIKVLRRLLETLVKKEIKVSPLDSPYSSKDLLKERGYFWSPEPIKLWSANILPDTLLDEAEWLKANVYNGRRFRLEQETMNAKNRFSIRRGTVEIVTY